MVLIMNVLKSKKIVKPRGSLKDADYDMEGSTPERGYEADTQDETVGGEEKNKGVVGSSKKKKKVSVDIDSDQESDFMEDLVRDFYKKSGRKGKRGKGISEERASSPSNDVTLARRLARKRGPPRC